MFNCKKGRECVVSCNAGHGACKGMRINAQSASKLEVISFAADSYLDATVYCPINGDCHFSANPLSTNYAFRGITILAKNGFVDTSVGFNCSSSDCLENGRINCTADYSQSCLIDAAKQNICIHDDVCVPPTNC